MADQNGPIDANALGDFVYCPRKWLLGTVDPTSFSDSTPVPSPSDMISRPLGAAAVLEMIARLAAEANPPAQQRRQSRRARPRADGCRLVVLLASGALLVVTGLAWSVLRG